MFSWCKSENNSFQEGAVQTKQLFPVHRANMIHVLLRQCNKVNSKARPDWFSHERVFRHFLSTLDSSCRLVVMFDGDPTAHFLIRYPVDVVRFCAGTDAASFRNVLAYARGQRAAWQPDDVVYFVEDDYLHRPGWPRIMSEAFEQQIGDTVSLYDHPDRFKPGSGGCHLAFTAGCHWRTAISTTNTFATRCKTLFEDIEIYERFADPSRSPVCTDHEKHIALWRERGRKLVTCVPAWSTHAEAAHLAPVVDWESVVSAA